MSHRVLFVALSLCLLDSPARPEVTAVAANGFGVKREASVKADAAAVYEALTSRVGSWWSPEHTFSGDAKNLSIAPVPGGCFCERWPGGSVLHMTVVYAAPGRALRMTGALGPMQGSGLAGSLTWELATIEGGTKIILTYVVGGYMAGGFEKIAPLVDGMLAEQVGRLKTFIETGSPVTTAK
jgi:uncharacterized protein YndB with AHSA1/START domain